MIACTRCGHWHTDAERARAKNLSCTEVKEYWSRIRNEHQELTGHVAQITTNESGELICLKCRSRLE